MGQRVEPVPRMAGRGPKPMVLGRHRPPDRPAAALARRIGSPARDARRHAYRAPRCSCPGGPASGAMCSACPTRCLPSVNTSHGCGRSSSARRAGLDHRPVRVAHVIQNLNFGGMERVLHSLVRSAAGARDSRCTSWCWNTWVTSPRGWRAWPPSTRCHRCPGSPSCIRAR